LFLQGTKQEGTKYFRLEENKKTILVVGGSQGARSINDAIGKNIDKLVNENIQLIWQTGKDVSGKIKETIGERKGIWIGEFITQMEYAYAAADLVISRAGAIAIAELCVMKKPVVFVPFPFAAEDHQTKNAESLVKGNAALIVKDSEVQEKLIQEILALAKNEAKRNELKTNISALAIDDADEKIADEIFRISNKSN
jgi:UDP-N-acetylglucosamine--N-acetylmuramyl-(pentapeptide) pyrophosphoryl-undecaprenol N-acetylglucosamine transferase